MTPDLYREIEALRTQKTKALKARYRELFGQSSPSSNHAHLFRRIAWRLQVLADGDLSQRARERAAELASDADVRLRAPRQFWRDIGEQGARHPGRDPRLPDPGTVLERQYQGRTIRVAVLTDGFEYDRKQYPSLSAIAAAVTGMRWNGYSFFGLNKAGQS